MDNTIVLEGWLTKSPPEKRIWKSKWRQRWFVLKQSNEIPGQHLLEYYADNAYKKFKGRIDLDDCEQVDAGLSLKFETGSRSNKHVFDLKTSKRVYYLATKTEEEMNKWVACICSVCGLRMRDDESESTRVGNRYSPQPSAETSPVNSAQVFTANNSKGTVVPATSNNATTQVNNNNNNLDVAALNYSVPRSSRDSSHHGNDTTDSRRPSKGLSSGEGPYIPISECHTGLPGGSPTATAKENRPSNQSTQSTPHPAQLPPPVLLSSTNSTNDRSVVTRSSGAGSSRVLRADEFYDVPRSSALSTATSVASVLPAGSPNAKADNLSSTKDKTFPKEDKNRASSRSCSASFDAKSSSTCNRTVVSGSALTGSNNGNNKGATGHRTRCESGPGTGGDRISSSTISSIRRSATPTADYLNCSDVPDFTTDQQAVTAGDPLKNPPPRPPKPATLSRSKIKADHQSSSPSLATDSYEVPRTASERATSAGLSPGKILPLDRSPRKPATPSSISNNGLEKSVVPYLLDHTVEKPVLSAIERMALDSSYDFPTTSKNVAPNEKLMLDSTVALHPSVWSESAKHPYDNSAAGFKSTKASVFIYDYRPSLPTMSDDQIVNVTSPGDACTSEDPFLTSEKSPRTPNSCLGSESTPPAVDRNLKPRRKGSDSDTTASPTTPNPFHLKPAPDGRRPSTGRLSAGTDVRGSAGSASTLPSVRNKSFTTSSATKNNGHQQQHLLPDSGIQHRMTPATASSGRVTLVHSREASTSEDDAQKSRSTDELRKKSRLKTGKQKSVPEGPELQYLDLDLDSDNSSPRTPNMVLNETQHKSGSSHKDPLHSPAPVPSTSSLPSGSPSSKSTVYKTVDFVKTDALNTLRNKVEEGSHRIAL